MTFPSFFVMMCHIICFPRNCVSSLHWIDYLLKINWAFKILLNSVTLCRNLSLSCAPLAADMERGVPKACTLWELEERFREAECHSEEMDF